MSDKSYYALTHVFTNKSADSDITLKCGSGETLKIKDATLTGTTTITDTIDINIGANKQVIYNNGGVLTGTNNMSYDGTNLFVDGGFQTQNIYGITPSDSLGYSQIYEGGAFPKSAVTAFTTDIRALGTDVSMSKSSIYTAFAGPRYILGGSYGGVSVWSESLGTFTESASVLTYTNFTLEATVKFTSVDETGSKLVLFDGNLFNGNITTYTRSGSTWTAVNDASGFSAGKISGNVMLAYNYASNFSTWTWSGSAWNQQQILMTNGLSTNYSLDYAIAIDSTNLAFSYGSNTYYYKYTTNWTLSKTFAHSSSSVDIHGDVLVANSSTTLYIYEDGILSNSFAVSNLAYCCTNGTYVFCITTGGVIRIYQKVGPTWTISANTYTLSGGAKMDCNANYLAVGAPSIGTYGTGYFFQINSYSNYGVVVNTLDLVDAGSRFAITAPTGVRITDATDSTSITTGSLQLLGGMGVSKSIWATTYNSANGAFKYAHFPLTSGDQAYTTPNLANILYKSAVINEIVGLTYDTGTGVFTTANAIRLLVSSFTTYFSASNCSVILRNITTSSNLCSISNSDSVFSNPAVSLTAIVELSAGTTFSMQIYANNTGNIKSGTNQTFIKFYTLN